MYIKLFLIGLVFYTQNSEAACAQTLDFTIRSLADKETVHLCEKYQGKVLLVVNTASKCGFTPQYDGLEALYKSRKGEGLVVLGFPSNDFANQEPAGEKNIQAFCRLTYGIQFPMFAKTRVKKGVADPFYERLAEQAGEYPQWNFHKYLINRNGKVVGSFGSSVTPESKELLSAIKKWL